ncbi:mannose-1-phosphate guanylyltransferase/mannose-6-phosphate isomerase [Marinomonas sp. PE14-40]|uniref:mannose-1-phosphate guanylyltransferase/mannose-6-phosphate isomerase n=1 Tax=Marinomonas sp. PE14-40 TaxID=3060621 RepID=UPI003F66FAEF
MKLTPVILCGGFGSRLWPASRLAFPKPCLTLNDNEPSLLQQTLIRIAHLRVNAPIIVCNQRHRFVIAEQIESLKQDYPYLTHARILLEPSARNTAPAIALAALESLTLASDTTLLVLPADHVIQKDERFDQSMPQAFKLAQANHLVTFGIQPTRAETGFGYIQTGQNCDVMAFIEKPNKETAQAYLAHGDYLWNSGMFMFSAKSYLSELMKYQPAIFDACQKAFKARCQDSDFTRIHAATFESCPADSIDYAVMEKTEKAKVVPFYCEWQDVGNWGALYDQAPKDEALNHLSGDIISQETQGCLIRSESRLVTTLGVENLVIIETPDAVLVMNKDKSHAMGELISHLKETGRSEYLNHQINLAPDNKDKNEMD